MDKHSVLRIASTVGRSIANISNRGTIFTEVRSAEINMLPRSDIEAMDRPTVLYVIYRMVSLQQANLSFCVRRQNIFKTLLFYTRRSIPLIQDFVAIHNFLWLHNHHTLYINIYVHTNSQRLEHPDYLPRFSAQQI